MTLADYSNDEKTGDIPGIIELPKVSDPRGNLTFFEDESQIPFEIERVFWTYDVPGGQDRGGHAYYKQQELIVAISGSFDVVVVKPNGNEVRYQLNRSYYGLYLPPKQWRYLDNFSTNALSLHASDLRFTEEDYVRDFNEYKNLYYE